MSRARKLLDVIEAMDPETDPKNDLNVASGYTYQDRGQKDAQGDTKKKSGTKPSGMQGGGSGGTFKK